MFTFTMRISGGRNALCIVMSSVSMIPVVLLRYIHAPPTVAGSLSRPRILGMTL